MRHRKANLTIEGAPLITVPVGICNAVARQKDVSLSIVFPDGRKAATCYRHPVTGEVVDSRPETRGIKIDKDEHGDIYGLVDTKAWERLNSNIKLHVTGFVDRQELIERVERVCEVHYLQVQPGFDVGSLAIIGEAMRRKDVVATVKFAVGKRERLGVLKVREDGVLQVLTLLYAGDIKDPDDEVLAPADVDVEEKAVVMAEKLIDASKVDAAVLDTEVDPTLEGRLKLINEAARGEGLPAPSDEPEPAPAGADLTAALEASLAATDRPKARKVRKVRTPS